MAKANKTANKVETVNHTVQTDAPSVDTPPADLINTVINLQDLRNVLVVFDLASARGAFKGPELEPVGQLYNKITKFVQLATPPTEEPVAGTTETVSV